MAELPYSESGLAREMDSLKDSQFYKWLGHELGVNSGNIVLCRDEVQLRWLQGQAQKLASLIASIDDAAEKAWTQRETMKRHEEHRKQHQQQY